MTQEPGGRGHGARRRPPGPFRALVLVGALLFGFGSPTFEFAAPASAAGGGSGVRGARARLERHHARRGPGKYVQAMNASKRRKAAVFDPWIPARAQKVYDIGTGTGELAAAVTASRSDVKVIGIDLSSTMVRHARAAHVGNRRVSFRVGSATRKFADGDADAALFSAILHEVYSYMKDRNGKDSMAAVRRALRATHRSLRPGGRIIIRDFVRPEDADRKVVIEQRPQEIACGRDFGDFAREFTARGRKVPATRLAPGPGGSVRFRTTLGWAFEYMLKKDYDPDHYEAELGEHYTFWSVSQARIELERAGFEVLHTQPLLSSRTEAIDNGNSVITDAISGRPIELPENKALIVAEKRTRISSERRLPADRRSSLERFFADPAGASAPPP